MEIFDSESKGIRAKATSSNGKFVVLSGSYAVGDVQHSLGDKPGRIAFRMELIQSGRLVPDGNRYRFAQDVEFNSPSEAASIIWGSNLNGRKVFGLDEIAPLNHILHFQIESPKAIEGYKQDQILQIADRDRFLADKRKALDNYTCQACGFKLIVEERFVIECHHLEPIALGRRETTLEDIVSLCPTCHRIAHMREPIYAITEIKQIRSAQNKS